MKATRTERDSMGKIEVKDSSGGTSDELLARVGTHRLTHRPTH